MNLRCCGNFESGDLGESLRRDRYRVRRAMAFTIPHRLPERRLFLVVGEIAAFLLQLRNHLVEDRGLDDEIAVGGASGAEVRCLRQHRVACRFLDVCRLVDDHRRVTRTHAIGRCARAIRCAHHWLSARRDDEVGARHGGLRHRDVDLGQALQDVGRRTFLFQGLPHQPHRFERGLLRARMRRKNHHVAGLDRVDRVARRREVRIGRGNDAGDDTSGLAVFDDPLFGDLLDDTDAFLPQCIAQHAADLHTLVHAAVVVAQSAFLDAFFDQPRECFLVGDCPGHGLAQPVHAAFGHRFR